MFGTWRKKSENVGTLKPKSSGIFLLVSDHFPNEQCLFNDGMLSIFRHAVPWINAKENLHPVQRREKDLEAVETHLGMGQYLLIPFLVG